MFGLFSQADVLLLLRLITAHLFVDFLLQTDSGVTQRIEKNGFLVGFIFTEG